MSNSLLYVGISLVAVAVLLTLAATALWRARTAPPRAPADPPAEPEQPSPLADIDTAAAAITSLRPDDAVVVCELEGLARLRATEGEDAVEALQLQLARHLGDRLLDDEIVARIDGDAFVVVLRAVHEPVERLVRRLIETWAVEHPSRLLHGGGALHSARSSPLDTAESARAALFAAQRQ